MKINTVGYDFRHGRNFKIVRPNGLNEYLLLIVRSTAVLEMNGSTHHILPNSMIMLQKGTPHSIWADCDAYINDWVSFDLSPSEYEELLAQHIQPNTLVSSADVLFCSDIIKLMQTENTSTRGYRHYDMLAFLTILFHVLCENSGDLALEGKYYHELKQIRDRIYENPCQKYSIKGLSAQIPLSKSYFQHLYQLYFRVSPMSDVIRIRIEYAKQLLVSTSYSVTEIAELLGYPDDIRFIKQFKQVAKITPGQYRKQI